MFRCSSDSAEQDEANCRDLNRHLNQGRTRNGFPARVATVREPPPSSVKPLPKNHRLDDDESPTDLMTSCYGHLPVPTGSPAARRLRRFISWNQVSCHRYSSGINGIEFIAGHPARPPPRVVMITGNNLSARRIAGQLASLKASTKPFGWRKLAMEIARVWPGRQ